MTNPKSKQFRLTGRHVLLAMLAFFGVIISVNVVFVRLALDSFPGEQVEKSYLQGLNYNEVLAARAGEQNRGWRMQLLSVPETISDGRMIRIRLVDRKEGALSDLSVRGSLRRPTTDDQSIVLKFDSLGAGEYQARVADVAPGAWDLSLQALEGDVPRLSAQTRIRIASDE